MGLRIETWSIAYRKRKNGLILEDSSNFKIINNGHKGWYADPFLYDYEGKTYLFAEFYSYKNGKGILVCSEFDEKKDCFEKFKPIIVEDYHLSYPNVYKYNGKIFLMPESSMSNTLYVYEAVNFPYEWEKTNIILEDISLVDTTVFMYNNNLYAVTMCLKDKDEINNGKMLLFSFDKNNSNAFNIIDYRIITGDKSIARPGGNVLKTDKQSLLVTQDCSTEYGKSLNFIKVDDLYSENPILKKYKKVTADQIKINNKKIPNGIHTYNVSDKFEVIDLKYYRRSYYRVFLKIWGIIKNFFK